MLAARHSPKVKMRFPRCLGPSDRTVAWTGCSMRPTKFRNPFQRQTPSAPLYSTLAFSLLLPNRTDETDSANEETKRLAKRRYDCHNCCPNDHRLRKHTSLNRVSECVDGNLTNGGS